MKDKRTMMDELTGSTTPPTPEEQAAKEEFVLSNRLLAKRQAEVARGKLIEATTPPPCNDDEDEEPAQWLLQISPGNSYAGWSRAITGYGVLIEDEDDIGAFVQFVDPVADSGTLFTETDMGGCITFSDVIENKFEIKKLPVLLMRCGYDKWTTFQRTCGCSE